MFFNRWSHSLHSLFFLYIAPIYFFNTLYIELMKHILNTCVHAVTPYSCCDQIIDIQGALKGQHISTKKRSQKSYLLIANQKKIIVLFEPLYTYHNPLLTSHHLNFKLAIHVIRHKYTYFENTLYNIGNSHTYIIYIKREKWTSPKPFHIGIEILHWESKVAFTTCI